MSTFEIIAKNNAASNYSFCVFQKGLATQMPGKTLSWLQSSAPINGSVTFRWQDNYNFVTCAPDQANSNYRIIQSVAADMDRNNMVNLSFDRSSNLPRFGQVSSGRNPGALTISTDSSIPRNENNFTMGIGMNGIPGFILESYFINANMNYAFTPKPEYYIVATKSAKVGDIIDDSLISSAAKIVFPANGGTMYATLTPTNIWNISPRQ
jgi:hypothetical protein